MNNENYYLAQSGFDINKLEDAVTTATGTRRLTDIGSLFSTTGTNFGITDLVFFFAGALAIIYLIYGGLLLMTSSGEPGKVAAGQQTVQNAIVGLVLVLASYLIVELVGIMLGLQGFSEVFG